MSNSFEHQDGRYVCIDCGEWYPEGMEYLAEDHECDPEDIELGNGESLADRLEKIGDGETYTLDEIRERHGIDTTDE